MNGVADVDVLQVAAKLFRGLGDQHRLAIVRELQHGERRVTDLVDRLGSSQATVSGHLACLKDCGLAADRPEGRANWYRIALPEVADLLLAADALLAATGHDIALCARYGSEQ